MYMGHIKYEYPVAANAPYLVQEVARGVSLPDGYTFDLSSDLKALFDRVRKSRPGWRLKSNHPTVVGNQHAIRSVSVWSGDNLLGKIWLESTYLSSSGTVTVYAYTNERVDRSLARRRYKTTTKMELAARGIIKMFYEDTFDERMKKVAPNARSIATESVAAAERPFRMVNTNAMVNQLTEFAVDNWTAFVAAYPTTDADLPEKFRNYVAASRARRRQVLYLHQLSNGEWTMGVVPDFDHTPTFTEATVADPRTVLTEEQFVSLTMLRLQDTNRFVEGHGVKINDTTFALVS